MTTATASGGDKNLDDVFEIVESSDMTIMSTQVSSGHRRVGADLVLEMARQAGMREEAESQSQQRFTKMDIVLLRILDPVNFKTLPGERQLYVLLEPYRKYMDENADMNKDLMNKMLLSLRKAYSESTLTFKCPNSHKPGPTGECLYKKYSYTELINHLMTVHSFDFGFLTDTSKKGATLNWKPHLRVSHSNGDICCCNCNFKTEHATVFLEHVRLHSVLFHAIEEAYFCEKCQKYVNVSSAKHHIETCSNLTLVLNTDTARLVLHYRYTSPKQIRSGHAFFTEGTYIQHISVFPNMIVSSRQTSSRCNMQYDDKTKLYICNGCHFKTPVVDAFLEHLRCHMTYAPYGCTACFRKFENTAGFAEHNSSVCAEGELVPDESIRSKMEETLKSIQGYHSQFTAATTVTDRQEKAPVNRSGNDQDGPRPVARVEPMATRQSSVSSVGSQEDDLITFYDCSTHNFTTDKYILYLEHLVKFHTDFTKVKPMVSQSNTTIAYKEGNYHCTVCDLKTPIRIVFQEHIRCHTLQQPFLCLTCKKQFKSLLHVHEPCRTLAAVVVRQSETVEALMGKLGPMAPATSKSDAPPGLANNAYGTSNQNTPICVDDSEDVEVIAEEPAQNVASEETTNQEGRQEKAPSTATTRPDASKPSSETDNPPPRAHNPPSKAHNPPPNAHNPPTNSDSPPSHDNLSTDIQAKSSTPSIDESPTENVNSTREQSTTSFTLNTQPPTTGSTQLKERVSVEPEKTALTSVAKSVSKPKLAKPSLNMPREPSVQTTADNLVPDILQPITTKMSTPDKSDTIRIISTVEIPFQTVSASSTQSTAPSLGTKFPSTTVVSLAPVSTAPKISGNENAITVSTITATSTSTNHPVQELRRDSTETHTSDIHDMQKTNTQLPIASSVQLQKEAIPGSSVKEQGKPGEYTKTPAVECGEPRLIVAKAVVSDNTNLGEASATANKVTHNKVSTYASDDEPSSSLLKIDLDTSVAEASSELVGKSDINLDKHPHLKPAASKTDAPAMGTSVIVSQKETEPIIKVQKSPQSHIVGNDKKTLTQDVVKLEHAQPITPKSQSDTSSYKAKETISTFQTKSPGYSKTSLESNSEIHQSPTESRQPPAENRKSTTVESSKPLTENPERPTESRKTLTEIRESPTERRESRESTPLNQKTGVEICKPLTESRTPSTESRIPSTERRIPSTESRIPSTESRKPFTESRKPSTESRILSTESRKTSTESREPLPEIRKPFTDSESGLVPTKSRQPFTEIRKPLTESPESPPESRELPPENRENASYKPKIESRKVPDENFKPTKRREPVTDSREEPMETLAEMAQNDQDEDNSTSEEDSEESFECDSDGLVRKNDSILRCDIVNGCYTCFTCDFTTTEGRLFKKHLMEHVHETPTLCQHLPEGEQSMINRCPIILGLINVLIQKTRGLDLQFGEKTLHTVKLEVESDNETRATNRSDEAPSLVITDVVGGVGLMETAEQPSPVQESSTDKHSDGTLDKSGYSETAVGVALYQCAVTDCDFGTNDQTSFVQHCNKTHSNLKVFKCRCCKKASFLDPTDLAVHIYNMAEGKIYLRCNHCFFTTPSLVKFENHLRKKHEKKKNFNCSLCVLRFGDINSLINHLHKSLTKVIRCTYCDGEFQEKKQLMGHIAKSHPGMPKRMQVSAQALCQEKRTPSPKKIVPPPVKAVSKGRTATKNIDQTAESINVPVPTIVASMSSPTVEEDAPYLECKQCDFQAFSKAHLEHHEQWHDTEGVRAGTSAHATFRCPSCPCVVCTFADFRFHLQFHKRDSKIKYFECATCKFRCNSEDTMETHHVTDHVSGSDGADDQSDDEATYMVKKLKVNFHAGRFTCPIETCSESFQQVVALQEHCIRLHERHLADKHLLDFFEASSSASTPIAAPPTQDARAEVKTEPGVEVSSSLITRHHCENCDFSTNDFSLLHQHVIDTHQSAGDHEYMDDATSETSDPDPLSAAGAIKSPNIGPRPQNGGNIKCSLCTYYTKHRATMSSHMKQHRKFQDYSGSAMQCGYCPYLGSAKHVVSLHLRCFHGESPVKILAVQMKDGNVVSKEDVVIKLRKRPSGDDHQPDEIDLILEQCYSSPPQLPAAASAIPVSRDPDESALTRHDEAFCNKVSGLKLYQCKLCSYMSETCSTVRVHYVAKHRDQLPLLCGRCHERTDPDSFRKHHQQHHPGQELVAMRLVYGSGEMTSGRPSSDQSLGLDLQPGEIEIEEEIDSAGVNDWQAAILNFYVTDPQDNLLCCNFCHYRAKTVAEMSRHLLPLHFKHCPIVCRYCNFGTVLMSKMKVHMRKLHSDVPFRIRRQLPVVPTQEQIQNAKQSLRRSLSPRSLHSPGSSHGPVTPRSSSTSPGRGARPLQSPTSNDGSFFDPNKIKQEKPESQATSFQEEGGCVKRTFQCLYCSHSSKWTCSDVQRHVLTTHLSYKLFNCDYCSVGHYSRFDLEQHCKSSHPTQPFSYSPLDTLMQAIRVVRQEPENIDVLGLYAPDGSAVLQLEAPRKQLYRDYIRQIKLEEKKTEPVKPTTIATTPTKSKAGNKAKKSPNAKSPAAKSPTVKSPTVKSASKSTTPSKGASPEKGGFQCKLCDLVLDKKVKIKYHIICHHWKLRPFMCPLCDTCNYKREQVRQHMLSAHLGSGREPLSLMETRRAELWQNVMPIAANKAKKKKKAKAKSPAAVAESEGEEELELPQEELWQCLQPGCGFVAAYQAVQIHVLNKHLNTEVYMCDFCSETGNRVEDLIQHLDAKHQSYPQRFSHAYGRFKTEVDRLIKRHNASNDSVSMETRQSQDTADDLQSKRRLSEPDAKKEREVADDTAEKGDQGSEKRVLASPAPTLRPKGFQSPPHPEMEASRSLSFECDFCAYASNESDEVREHTRLLHGILISPGKVAESAAKTAAQGPTTQRQALRLEPEPEPQVPKTAKPKPVRTYKYGCTLCTFIAYEFHAVRNHVMRQHVGYLPFSCRHCGESAATKNQMRMHIAAHKAKHVKQIYKGDREKELEVKQHIRRVPREPKPQTEPGPIKEKPQKTSPAKKPVKRRASDDVTKETPQKRKLLGAQPKKGPGQKQLKIKKQCQFCEFTAPSTGAVNKHVSLRHTGQGPAFTAARKELGTSAEGNKQHRDSPGIKYGCALCHYRNGKQTAVYRHLEKHFKYRPYACFTCSTYASAYRFRVLRHSVQKHGDRSGRFVIKRDENVEEKIAKNVMVFDGDDISKLDQNIKGKIPKNVINFESEEMNKSPASKEHNSVLDHKKTAGMKKKEPLHSTPKVQRADTKTPSSDQTIELFHSKPKVQIADNKTPSDDQTMQKSKPNKENHSTKESHSKWSGDKSHGQSTHKSHKVLPPLLVTFKPLESSKNKHRHKHKHESMKQKHAKETKKVLVDKPVEKIVGCNEELPKTVQCSFAESLFQGQPNPIRKRSTCLSKKSNKTSHGHKERHDHEHVSKTAEKKHESHHERKRKREDSESHSGEKRKKEETAGGKHHKPSHRTTQETRTTPTPEKSLHTGDPGSSKNKAISNDVNKIQSSLNDKTSTSVKTSQSHDTHSTETHTQKVKPREVVDCYRCVQCPFETRHRVAMVNHVMWKLDYRPYRCSRCSYSTVFSLNVKTHIVQKHKGLAYEKEKIDPRKVKEVEELVKQSEIKKVVHDKPQQNRSQTSPAGSLTSGTSKASKLTAAARRVSKSSERTTGYDSDRLSVASAPRTERKQDLVMRCFACSYRTRTEINLIAHIQQHRHVGKKIRCRFCGFATREASEFRDHVRDHVRSRPYRCSRCSKSFKLQGEAREHCHRKHGGHAKARVEAIEVLDNLKDAVRSKRRRQLRALHLHPRVALPDFTAMTVYQRFMFMTRFGIRQINT